ncbi:50S ribosomal protein L18 [bacterium]|nr:50S ribosomal protein L18 [bacterium]
MSRELKEKRIKRERRHRKTRAKIHGTSLCPRICVFRSNKNIYVNMIDDENNKVMMTFSSLSKESKEGKINGSNVKAAVFVGELAGKKAIEKGIKKGIFDRSGYRYHGRVKAVAEGLKKAGI